MPNWKPENRLEITYARALNRLVKQMFKSLNGVLNPYEIVKRLKKLSKQKKFKDYCESIALTMVTHINKKVSGGWRKAAFENGKGNQVRNALIEEIVSTNIGRSISEQVAVNATIIKTLPQNIAEEVVKYIEVEAATGRRSEDIANDIVKMFPEKTKANAKLIARTEVSKTQSALVRARAEAMGIAWYIWRTSKDSRTRSSHEIMDGILVAWNDPPNPEELDGENKYKQARKYHPGGIYNCRCYSEPVISWDLVDFPCDVYFSGKIQSMTKAEFMQTFNISNN